MQPKPSLVTRGLNLSRSHSDTYIVIAYYINCKMKFWKLLFDFIYLFFFSYLRLKFLAVSFFFPFSCQNIYLFIFILFIYFFKKVIFLHNYIWYVTKKIAKTLESEKTHLSLSFRSNNRNKSIFLKILLWYFVDHSKRKWQRKDH